MATAVAFQDYDPAEDEEDMKIKPMRIAFVHLNLGIGGAERWLVDAALALQDRGHQVEIFTNYHEDGDDGRSFIETRNGQLSVHVLGDWLFPQHLFGNRFVALCATLRQIHLALAMLFAVIINTSGFYTRWFRIDKNTPYKSSNDWSWRRSLDPFDVIIIDQLPTISPILRFMAPVVYYCHFPDLLLAKHTKTSFLRKLYRWPLDTFESLTTFSVDKPVVNSKFTYHVYRHTFPNCGIPDVVEPAVDTDHFVPRSQHDVASHLPSFLLNQDIFLSINRFEGAKNLPLALHSFADMKTRQSKAYKLVIAGGYDPLNKDNKETLAHLVDLANELNLSHTTFNYAKDTSPPQSKQTDIYFLLNITDDLKTALLGSSKTICVLYTPPREHFGIVPIEAMSSGRLILAVNSGGPLESINDFGLDSPDSTGFLRKPMAEEWTPVLDAISTMSLERREQIAQRARQRVIDEYSISRMGEKLELCAHDAKYNGRVWFFMMLLIFLMFPVFAWLMNTLSSFTEKYFSFKITPD